jgi:hypothetical protein
MKAPTELIVYTLLELDAIRQAQDLLLDANFCKKNKRAKPFSEKQISKRHLAVTVLISKSRPKEAAVKYLQWIQGLSTWGIHEFSDEQLTNPPKRSDFYLRAYKLAGRDINGSRIFWIDGKNPIPNDAEEEKMAIYAGLRYQMAVHADAKTIREGLTFVIDVTNKPKEKVGNEKRLQSSYNVYPLRPQHIFIIGANRLVRTSINLLLKVTGFVSKVKILRRIKFVTLDEATDTENGGSIPKENLPQHLKSLDKLMANMDIKDEEKKSHTETTSTEAVVQWVNQQISQIPMPDI